MRHVDVKVTRSEGMWAIYSDDVDGLFSQARRLDQVEAMAIDALTGLLDLGHDDITVTVDIQKSAIHDHLESLTATLVKSAELDEIKTSLRLDIASKLAAEGYSQRDIAVLIGCSHQRVSKLLNKNKTLANA